MIFWMRAEGRPATGLVENGRRMLESGGAFRA
jgi:hypothetical protein